jgi:autotransporter-associated beta strand protein
LGSGGIISLESDGANPAVLNFTGSTGTPPSTNRPFQVNSSHSNCLNLDSNIQLTLAGPVTSPSSANTLTKTGSGTLTLGGANDNSNLILGVSSGLVVLSKTSSATVHAVAGIADIAAGAAVQLNGNDQIAGSGGGNAGLVNLGGGTLDLAGFSDAWDRLTGHGTITNSQSATSVVTLGESNGTSTFDGTLQNGAGAIALIKTGTGTLTLSQPIAFTGTTTVNGGTLELLQGISAGTTPSVSVSNGARLIAPSISTHTLTIAAGGCVQITALPNGPLASPTPIQPVPEPGTTILLALLLGAGTAWLYSSSE